MLTSAWTARQLKARSVQIQYLKAQVKAYQMNLYRAQKKIKSLSSQLAEALQAEGEINPCHN
jgi:septal ring factor EnvC (AmiA/AmiB activator)